jgi:hypothetical protein
MCEQILIFFSHLGQLFEQRLLSKRRVPVNYYMLQRLRGGEPGHPVFFEYKYDKESGGANSKESPFVVFYTGYEKQPLVFTCKHRRIDFDLYDIAAGEYFVSELFLGAAEGLGVSRHTTSKVRFQSAKKQEIPGKQYRVLRLFDTHDAVDPSRSVIEKSEQYDYRTITKHLALNPGALDGLDRFRIADKTLLGCLFCSERFKNAAESAGVSLTFVPEAEAAEAFAASNPFGPK